MKLADSSIQIPYNTSKNHYNSLSLMRGVGILQILLSQKTKDHHKYQMEVHVSHFIIQPAVLLKQGLL